ATTTLSIKVDARDIDDRPRRRGDRHAVQPGHVRIWQLGGVGDDPWTGIRAGARGWRHGYRHSAVRGLVQQTQPVQLSGRSMLATPLRALAARTAAASSACRKPGSVSASARTSLVA